MRSHVAMAALFAVLSYAGAARADSKVMLKGGMGLFTGDLGRVTSVGPAWGLAMNFQPLDLIGIEFAYEGSRNALTDPTALGSTGLFRNGGSGMIKLSPLPIPFLTPFVAAGLGGAYVTVQGQETPLYQNGFTLEAPIAAGIELNILALTVGARATYRLLLTQQFAIPSGSNRGNLFDVTGTLGLRF